MKRLVSTDDKRRINLGKPLVQLHFLLSDDNDNINLERTAITPEKELWFHQNPEVKKMVISEFKQAREGKGIKNTVDLNAYETGE